MANTTNLDLVKPAGTDKALVSVINANSDKIDTFAGSTNQAIQTLNSNKANKIQTMIVEGTTDADGDIVIGLSAESYALVSCSPDRNTSDYYTSWYTIIPYGVNNEKRYSAKCINDNIQKLSSTAVRFKVHYIQI